MTKGNSRGMNNRGDTAVIVVCGLALLAVMTVAQAQGLADPTRPPAAVENPAPGAAGASGEPAATGLQAIIRRDGAQPVAVINGENVTLGGRVGDARVVKIGEDSVTLKSAVGQETLKLMPGIEKKPVVKAEKKAGTKKARKAHAGKEAEK